MKLTPNRRMAINSHEDDIFPITAWLENLYSTLILVQPDLYPDRLGINEELIIWEKIISESDIGQTLFKTTGTARLAREAWILSVQWRILSLEGVKHTEDTQAFYEWASQYQILCSQKRWVDSATFIDVLIDPILKKQIDLPKEIILVGFEELTPQLTYFFDRIKEIGIVVKSMSQALFKGQAKRIALADFDEELRCSAFMAKHWLQAQNKMIGIVVPDLERQRHRVVRLLEEVLPLESFNVAAPIALKEYPIIEAALLALSLLSREHALETFSQFLRSPFFWNAGNEQVLRTALDVRIRQLGEPEFTFERFIKKIEYIVKNTPELTCLAWLSRLQDFAKTQLDIRGKKSAIEWRTKILALLEILGWPGDRCFSDEEQAVKQQWYRLLADYVHLGRVLSHHDYQEALHHLMRLARETSFLPASSPRPIQVLGLLEAVGMPFDHLWIIGLHREAWPLDPMPNPLIPLSLQREKNLPRSGSARELTMAKKFTERLCQGAPDVIFSYPTMVDGHPSVASALLMHLPEITRDFFNIPKTSSYLECQAEIKYCELNEEGSAPKVDLSERAFGGAQLLKLQALCPFWAFAEGRLQALPLPAPKAPGLSAVDRGEIIHQVLYVFWEGMENQTELQALTEEALIDRICLAIEVVFQEWQLQRSQSLAPQYLTLEKKRTYQLIYRFIQLEKSRPYFEVVAREEERIIDLHGLKFKIRIDRIDRLLNLDEIIIDYKTSDPSLSNLFGDRPREPQLPLYCVTHKPTATGIVYGVVRPETIKFQGVAKEESTLPGIKALEQVQSLGAEKNWEDQCASWESKLGSLAKAFAEGVATVDPIDGGNTCRICSLKSLCRIKSFQ